MMTENSKDVDVTADAESTVSAGQQLPQHGFFTRLYTGTGAFDVVGKRKLWYVITALIVALAGASIVLRGFTFGIDFQGGTKVSFPVAGVNGNASVTNFKLQGEYLRRTENGDLTYDTNAASTGTATDRYVGVQSGWYLQGVYQFAPKWRVGVRTERLSTGSIDYGSNGTSLQASRYAPSARALMFDYNPSEFSRIRLQFAQDKSREGITDNQIFLHYQMSLGAHGAHKF